MLRIAFLNHGVDDPSMFHQEKARVSLGVVSRYDLLSAANFFLELEFYLYGRSKRIERKFV